MKIGCFIYSNSEKYRNLQECAKNSFLHFHPEVHMFSYDNEYKMINELKNIPVGIARLFLAYSIFEEEKLDKIIILGADTITCSRLNEFIDENSFDILTTLDYPYKLISQNIAFSNNDQDHVNADVVCYNNKDALKEVVKKSFEIKTEYFEQAALNYVCNIEKKYTSKIVDGDYTNSNIVYNVRSKGNIIAKPNEKPWFKYTNLFEVKNKKLYTGIHENCLKSKQIKVWHYCDALGNMTKSNFENTINGWIEKGFNESTRNFFSNECNCKDFFKQKFTI